MSGNLYGRFESQEQALEHLKQVAGGLLRWYDNNARVLPWRENKDPYRIWISEIMLQQTRVEAVKPYYERFLAQFPDVSMLASAPLEKVLKAWEGLGYYSRARNLHKAANQIMSEFSGQFPRTAKELRTLVGIGEYTAGAIASIAFEERVPAVDGNVLRVISRLIESKADILKVRQKKALASLAQDMMPYERIGDYNQAMMEIGALICVPNGAPQCGICPLAGLCLAHKNGCEEDYPKKSPKKERRKEDKTVLLLHGGDRVLLHRREDIGLLAGLWEFPMAEGKVPAQKVLSALGVPGENVKKIVPTKDAKHIFSHVEWHMAGYLIELSGPFDAPWGYSWANKQELLERYPVANAQKQYRELILKLI